MNKQTGKEELVEVTRFYPTKANNGNYRSIEVTAETMDALSTLEVGGRLLLMMTPEDKIGEKTPHARLKVLPKQDQAGFKASKPVATRNTRARSNSEDV